MTTPIFLDTSGLFALLNVDDEFHIAAKQTWHRLLEGLRRGEHTLLTHHSVVVESSALTGHRLGLAALRELHDGLLPVAEIVWIEEKLHRRATAAMFGASRRAVSLVDWLSFELMRDRRIQHAFTFDAHFAEQGFLPA